MYWRRIPPEGKLYIAFTALLRHWLTCSDMQGNGCFDMQGNGNIVHFLGAFHFEKQTQRNLNKKTAVRIFAHLRKQSAGGQRIGVH